MLLFAFLGFEGGSSASGEMRNAQHDVSVSVLRSATMAGIFLPPSSGNDSARPTSLRHRRSLGTT
ncbi:agmatine/putrescine antiporter [Cutibacterium acnes JCM 18918]|nr:agmatine/putrescine antiporter [Cutibacterium acnes JCM 18918]